MLLWLHNRLLSSARCGHNCWLLSVMLAVAELLGVYGLHESLRFLAWCRCRRHLWVMADWPFCHLLSRRWSYLTIDTGVSWVRFALVTKRSGSPRRSRLCAHWNAGLLLRDASPVQSCRAGNHIVRTFKGPWGWGGRARLSLLDLHWPCRSGLIGRTTL